MMKAMAKRLMVGSSRLSVITRGSQGALYSDRIVTGHFEHRTSPPQYIKHLDISVTVSLNEQGDHRREETAGITT
jgi:hypothetical protein